MQDSTRRASCLGALALVAVCASACFEGPRPGKLRERWERTNGTVQVRAEIYDEGDPGHRFAIFDERRCHLKLMSAPRGSDSWHEVATAYFGPCDADIKSRLRFVNDRVAYLFMQWWFVVTIDGGQTWQMWDVARNNRSRAYASPELVDDVSIQSDGVGTMSLNPVGTVDHKRLTMHTGDFGLTWTVE